MMASPEDTIGYPDDFIGAESPGASFAAVRLHGTLQAPEPLS